MSKDNIQLPADVLKELEAAAQDKYTKMAENAEDERDTAYAQGYAEGWHTGATEYAIKLLQVEKERQEERQQRIHLEKENDIIASNYKDLQQKHTTARTLLEKVASRREAGLLPDRFIYQEIKKFLDGK